MPAPRCYGPVMLRLHYVPKTRATRPRWLLEELGVSYELVRLDPSKGETRTAEHTARHPLQHVPVLETERGVLFESAALVLHLAERHQERPLLPPEGSFERGLALQWIFYAMTELEPQALAVYVERVQKKQPDSIPCREARAKLAQAVRPLERPLSEHPFLLPGGFSAADVVLGSVLLWAHRMEALPDDVPRVRSYVAALEARPAYQRATAD